MTDYDEVSAFIELASKFNEDQIKGMEAEYERAKADNDTTVDVCEPCPRYFVVIHGHPGNATSLGEALKNAANTHKKEIEKREWPVKKNWKIPNYRKGIDKVFVFYTPYAQEIEKSLSSLVPNGRVVYLAIYSHMAHGSPHRPGLLFLNPDTNVGANLSSFVDRTSTLPLTTISKAHFLKISDSQVRLFGCFGASEGVHSIAGQLKEYLGIDAYGFNDKNATGSQGTNDKSLGHGERAFIPPKSNERIDGSTDPHRPYKYPGDAKPPNGGDTWFINVAPREYPDFVKL